MTPQQIVEEVEGLLSLPDAVIRVNELIDSPNASAAEIGEVIAVDPALSAQLLKLANSAFYSLPNPVQQISRAVNIIGTHALRSLIFSASATQVFNNIAPQRIDMDDFWHRSVYIGLVTAKLSRLAAAGGGEGGFLTGLLHDIGKIVLFSRRAEEMGRILDIAHDRGLPLQQIENELFGYCAADIGAELLRHWRISEEIYQPIRFQHQPESAGDFVRQSRTLHLAMVITDCVEPELKQQSPVDLQQIDTRQQWFQAAGLTLEQIDQIIMESNMECFEILQIVNPDSLTIF